MKLQNIFLQKLGILAGIGILCFLVIVRHGIDTASTNDVISSIDNHKNVSLIVIDDIQHNIKTDLVLISADSLTRRFFSSDETTRYQLFHHELTRTLSRYLRHRDHYLEIALVLPSGSKDVIANSPELPYQEFDNFIAKNQAALPTSEEYIYNVTFNEDLSKYIATNYLPIMKYTNVIKNKNNTVMGYVKISIDLNEMASTISTPRILSVFEWNGEYIYDVELANKLGIVDLKHALVHDAIIERTSEIDFGGILIQMTPLSIWTADFKTLHIQLTLIVLIGILSLLLTTFLLLKKLVLVPLEQFNKLIDHFETDNPSALNKIFIEDNEIGFLKHKFQKFMQQISETSNKLELQAFTDTLTGLPNRAAINHILNNHLATNTNTPFSLLFIDLDGFKQVNDIYGHETGDNLLIEVANRLTSIIRKDDETNDNLNLSTRNDVVIRLGGDEFTIILTGNQNAQIVADRIIKNLRSGFIIDGRAVYAGASIGIAEYPEHAPDLSLLFQYADMAMYKAKRLGKMRSFVFTPALAIEELDKLKIEQTVREGIEFDRYTAYLQPKVNIKTNEITGFEALARLKDRDGNIVPPIDFIPAAQDEGVLEYITYLVTEKSCQMLQCLNNPKLTASINISPSQLLDFRLLADIRYILFTYGITPNQIEFEVTEEEIIKDTAGAQNSLEMMRKFGFKTALDDFGVGYSSLGQLKHFQFDTLKLDRVFINTDDYDSKTAIGILKAIKDIAQTLNMSIVAEGIEELEHVQFMSDLDIEIAQGYFYSKPLPSTQFFEYYMNSQIEKDNLTNQV